MNESVPGFEWYDAWILAAILYAGDGKEPVPLWRVIACADALNKAIISRSELELGIARLVSAGYVRVAVGQFEVTRKSLALKLPGSPMENIAKALPAIKWSAEAKMPRTANASYVSSLSYQRALKQYRKEFRNFMASK